MQKDTNGKLRLDLIPPGAEEAIAKVREFGSKKYKKEWAWKGSVEPNDLITAAQRHIRAFRTGEVKDGESRLPHIWHALTSLAMAVEIMPGLSEYVPCRDDFPSFYEEKDKKVSGCEESKIRALEILYAKDDDRASKDWLKVDEKMVNAFMEEEELHKVEGYGFFKKH